MGEIFPMSASASLFKHISSGAAWCRFPAALCLLRWWTLRRCDCRSDVGLMHGITVCVFLPSPQSFFSRLLHQCYYDSPHTPTNHQPYLQWFTLAVLNSRSPCEMNEFVRVCVGERWCFAHGFSVKNWTSSRMTILCMITHTADVYVRWKCRSIECLL